MECKVEVEVGVWIKFGLVQVTSKRETRSGFGCRSGFAPSQDGRRVVKGPKIDQMIGRQDGVLAGLR